MKIIEDTVKSFLKSAEEGHLFAIEASKGKSTIQRIASKRAELESLVAAEAAYKKELSDWESVQKVPCRRRSSPARNNGSSYANTPSSLCFKLCLLGGHGVCAVMGGGDGLQLASENVTPPLSSVEVKPVALENVDVDLRSRVTRFYETLELRSDDMLAATRLIADDHKKQSTFWTVRSTLHETSNSKSYRRKESRCQAVVSRLCSPLLHPRPASPPKNLLIETDVLLICLPFLFLRSTGHHIRTFTAGVRRVRKRLESESSPQSDHT